MTEPGVTEPGVTELTPSAEPWHRLSPRKMLLDPVQTLARALVPIVVAVVTVQQVRATIVFIACGVLFAIVGGMVPYLTTRYRITATHFEVRTGWLNRKTNTAALTRIRSVDLEASLLYRALAMEKITIGTGVDGEQVELDALPRDQAAALRTLLLTRGEPASHPVVEQTHPVQVLAVFTPAWAKFAPLHLTGFVLLAAGLGAAASFVAEVGGLGREEVEQAWDWVRQFAVVSVAVVALVLLLAAWLVLSLVSYLSEWFGLRLWREAGTLHLTRGLLTTRSVSLEEQRIRGVTLTQRLLVRLFGGAELTVQSSGEGASQAKVLPTAPRPVVEQVARQVLGPDVLNDGVLSDDGLGDDGLGESDPVTVTVHSHPRAALRRRVGWGLCPALAVALFTAAGLAEWLPFAPGAWVSERLDPRMAVVLVGVVAVWGLLAGWLAYRHLGHAVTPRHLVRTGGIFSLRREVLETEGIIGWVVKQSVFQRRTGLATLVATTAAGRERVEIPDLAVAEAFAVAAACTPRTVAPFLVA